MSAEGGRLEGGVGVDVQHSAVIVAEDSHPVVTHSLYGPGGIDPVLYFFPDRRFPEVTRYDIIFEARPVEHAGELRSGAGLAMSQPLAGHFPPVAQSVDIVVVYGRYGLEV